MANTAAWPSNDVVKMAELGGWTVFEIDLYWTDELLKAKMEEYYAGILQPTVNPAQGIRTTGYWETFFEETAKDLGSFVEGLGSGFANITANLAIVAIVVGIYLLSRK